MARRRTTTTKGHTKKTAKAHSKGRNARGYRAVRRKGAGEWKRNLLLLAIVLLFCAVIFEIAVRILWHNEPQYGYPEGMHQVDPQLGYTYVPNFQGYFLGGSYENISISINSQGLRDVEHTFEKPKRTIRILGIGDSVTVGAGVAYEQTYLRVLEKKLLADGYRVEVIKAGHGGYNYNQEYLFYELYGKQYDPDIVLFGVVLDDVVARDVNHVALYEVQITPLGRFMNFLGKHWKSGKFVYWFYKNVLQLRSQDYNQVYFEQVTSGWRTEHYDNYTNATLALADEIDGEHRDLVFAIFPYTEQLSYPFNESSESREPQRLMKALVDKTDATFIDVSPAFQRPDYETLYLYADQAHFSPLGNELAAQQIHDTLVKLPIFVQAKRTNPQAS